MPVKKYTVQDGVFVHERITASIKDTPTKEFEEIVVLLEKLYEKKEIPKTGKKFISSIQTFINRNYLRINDIELLLRKMELFKIVSKINKNQIQISYRLLNISDKRKFHNIISKLINASNTEIDLVKFANEQVSSKI